MENNLGSISWLHGLANIFKFKGNDNIAQVCDQFLKIMYSKNKANSMRNIIHESVSVDPAKLYQWLNYYCHAANSEDSMKLEELTSALNLLFPEESIFKDINKFYRETNLDISDALSKGQVDSKIWLVEELSKIKTDFKMIYLLAGWFGQLTWMFDNNIYYEKLRVFDIDAEACRISDQIINVSSIENYKVKSAEVDLTNMDWLYRTGCEYKLKNYTTNTDIIEKSIPDLIINTSAEHFHERWYHKFVNRPLPTDPLFVIQSNNLHNIQDHINSIHSIDEMKIKFPMSRIEYEGELQLQGYKRYMLIGRP